MPGKRKRFIEKKNAVTYRLVPRCQLDPDGDTSEHVLVPVNEIDHEKLNFKLPEIVLPPPVKVVPSLKKQTPVKGPHPDWDPDIVAALDDDFDYEDGGNALDDDFIAMANGPVAQCQGSTESMSDDENCDSSNGHLLSDDDESFFGFDEEGKTRFTQYSLTSAATNCPEEVQILNERFKKLCESYDDDQIGALDLEDIDGYITADSKTVESLAEDFQKSKKLVHFDDSCLDENMKNRILKYAEIDEDEKLVKVIIHLPVEYDSQSIISTYSNKYNHPALIKADKKEKPVKIPTNLWKQKLTKSNLRQLDREASIKGEDEESVFSENNQTIVSSCNFRPKDETPEERKIRKQTIKQQRRDRRILKKGNQIEFKEQKKKQTSVALNSNRNKGRRLL